jgi:hypothetical protein
MGINLIIFVIKMSSTINNDRPDALRERLKLENILNKIANVDTNNVASKDYVDEKLENVLNGLDLPDLPANLASKDYVDNAISEIELGYYATYAYVDNMIAGVEIPDLTGYATETFVNNIIQVNNTSVIAGKNNTIVGSQTTAIGTNMTEASITTGSTELANNNVIIGDHANVKGANKVAVGYISSAESNAVANGMHASAKKEGVAVGYHSYSDVGGVAIGHEAEAIIFLNSPNDSSVAIGNKAHTEGKENVAIGHALVGTSERIVAIGTGINITGSESYNAVVIGNNPVMNEGAPNCNNSVCIGDACDINGDNHIVIGSHAVVRNNNMIAMSNNGIAIGNTAQSTANYAIAMGTNASAQSENSIAIGHNASVVNGDSVVIGYNSSSSEYTNVLIGPNLWTEGSNNILIGEGIEIGDSNYIRLGNDASEIMHVGAAIMNISPGTGEITFQQQPKIVDYLTSYEDNDIITKKYVDDVVKTTDTKTVVVGKETANETANSVVIGYGAKDDMYIWENTTDEGGNVIIGYKAQYTNDRSIVIGAKAQSFYEGAIVIGRSATAWADNNIIIGNGLALDDDNCIKIGNSDMRHIYLGPIEIRFSGNNIIFEKDGESFTMNLT